MNIRGKINDVEFRSGDLAPTKRVFGEVFGWEFQDYGPEYVAFSGAGFQMAEPVPRHFLFHSNVRPP